MNCIITAWGKHEAELRGGLTQQTGNQALAEDILQETFLRAMTEAAKFCSLDNPRAWLYRVARNQLIDDSRRYATRHQVDELTDDLPDDIEEIPAVKTLDICLPSALNKLTPVDRDAIQRCDLDGELQAEYADSKGLTLSAAKSRLQRARQRLKAESCVR